MLEPQLLNRSEYVTGIAAKVSIIASTLLASEFFPKSLAYGLDLQEPALFRAVDCQEGDVAGSTEGNRLLVPEGMTTATSSRVRFESTDIVRRFSGGSMDSTDTVC